MPSERPIQLRCIVRTLSGQSVQPVERGEQVVAEGAGAEEPLGQVALLDLGAGPPAPSVDDLLVGQHRLVDRIPVDLRDFRR